MRSFNRRDFLQSSLASAAALAGATPCLLAEEETKTKKPGANDRLHVAIVGVNGRGKEHLPGFNGKNDCIITTICDCDEGVIGPIMKAVEGKNGHAPKFERDIRKVLDDKSIDIVTIATPNHWHALAAVWALQAGKHVYVEKPVSHNVSEGRRIVEAARKYNKICQTGTQSRSMPGMRDAIEFVRTGGIGKVTLARGLCYKSRPSIGKVDGEGKIPATCDYDLWCGPAPKAALHRKRLHYDWHWVWDTGNGDLGNQGIHQMDIARWGLGKNEMAKSVLSFGGRFGYIDDGETANTQVCVFDYGDAQLIFEVRGLKTNKLLGAGVGVIFYGSDGFLVCPNYESGFAYSPTGDLIKKFTGPKDNGQHFANFVKAVRSGKCTDLNADIQEGHLSSALCHLGNISYRLGTKKTLNQMPPGIGFLTEAGDSFGRMREHLEDNKVPLGSTEYHIGRKLTIDSQAESFVNDSEANAMLTREYRKPYVMPEKV